MKRTANRYESAMPLVNIKMNPHSQVPELNAVDVACFSETNKFPDVFEQQFILDADDMDDMMAAAGHNGTDNYK